MPKKDFHKVVVGRAELLHLMDFAIADIPAKVDTGAYNSSIHADNIRLSEDGQHLTFRLLGGHPVFGGLATEITTPYFKRTHVVNSFGHGQHRYMINLRVKLGPKIFPTTFSLADRSTKIYPVLIGRKLLNKRFVVDTMYSQVDRSALKSKFGIELPADKEEQK